MCNSRVIEIRLLATILISSFIGCAEKPAAKPIASNTSQPSEIASDEVCKSLQSHPDLSTRYNIFISALCGNGQATLTLLRSSEYLYKGNGKPTIKIDATESANKKDGKSMSEMQTYAALATPASPLSYFELIQLKTDRPSEFSQKFPPEYYDAEADYNKISGTISTGVRYRYKKETGNDAGDIDYEATARFFTLTPNKLYVVTTEHELTHDMIHGLRGLNIISSNNGMTEVIGISNQWFENGDNHSSAVTDAKTNLERELNYNYKQSIYKHSTLDK